MTTITLGAEAAGLLVNVQRGADKTFAMRLLDGETNVTDQHSAAIEVGAVSWAAVVEEVEASDAFVWRLDEDDTALEAGSHPARLVITHTSSTQETVLAIGKVVAR